MIISKDCNAFGEKYLSDTIELIKVKNKRYGDSVLNPRHVFPVDGDYPAMNAVFVRLNDKLSRLANQLPGEDEDVVRDIIGYLMFAVIMTHEDYADTPDVIEDMTKIKDIVINNVLNATMFNALCNDCIVCNKVVQIDTGNTNLDEAARNLTLANGYVDYLLRFITTQESIAAYALYQLISAFIVREYFISRLKEESKNGNES